MRKEADAVEKSSKVKKRFKLTRIRRITQLLVLLTIILVPALSQNIYDWSPSEVVMGRLPPPSMFPITGDTWSLEIGSAYIMHPVAFLESAVSSRSLYTSALAAVIVPLVLTLLFGRVFCSWLCPIGLILELVVKINDKKKYIPWIKKIKLWDFRYTFAGVLLILCFLFGVTLISVFDPPHALGREMVYLFTDKRLSIAGTGLLAFVLIVDLLILRRGWCRYLCPSGGCLSIIGKARLLRLKLKNEECIDCGICSQACQFGLNPTCLKTDPKAFKWTVCDNCAICADNCPKGAIGFELRMH